MRISHQHKFVWISKPKTGSTSVRKLLDKYSDIKSTDSRPYHHHTTVDQARALFAENGWNFDDYQVFVCDRNPWDLMTSIWKYSKVNERHQKFFEKNYDPSLRLIGFDEFVRAKKTWDWMQNHHRLEVFAGAEPRPANVRVYDIGGQQDQLLADLSAVVGKTLGPLGQHNKSDYSPEDLANFRTAFADPEVDAKLRATFASTISRFAYDNPYR